MNTLDISNRIIQMTVKKYDPNGIVEISKQGLHIKKSVNESIKDGMRSHINSFPRINSHYCRKDTQKEYVEGA